MDDLLQLTAMLFILSMVCERIANFLKFKLSHTKEQSKIFGFRNTSLPEDDEADEKEREFRIMKINILCGILTALLLKADLIGIAGNLGNPQAAMGWENLKDITPWYVIQIIIGCSLTGLFISLGSKFWHDLLDMLLYVKNIKKAVLEGKEIVNEITENNAYSASVKKYFEVEFYNRQDEIDNR